MFSTVALCNKVPLSDPGLLVKHMALIALEFWFAFWLLLEHRTDGLTIILY